MIAPLGISRDGEEASWLGFVHRVAVPEDEAALEEYIRNPPYKLFRVTPVDPATGEVGREAVFDPDPGLGSRPTSAGHRAHRNGTVPSAEAAACGHSTDARH